MAIGMNQKSKSDHPEKTATPRSPAAAAAARLVSVIDIGSTAIRVAVAEIRGDKPPFSWPGRLS